MAGPDPDAVFDADSFRESLRFAMTMGLPEPVDLRPTFHFPKVTTSVAPADPGGLPWDHAAPVVEPSPVASKQVVCLVEPEGGGTGYTNVGKFTARRATLSFFEDEWADIDGWEWVSIGGNRYDRGPTLEPLGLFEVTLYRVDVVAADV